jgi:hypothetical protein
MPVGVTNQVAGFDRSVNLPLISTVDATPVPQVIYSVPRDTTVRLNLALIARAPDGRSKTWTVIRTGKNASGVLSLVGAAPSPTIEADAGTSGWSAQLSANSEDVILTVTGEAGTPVYWVLLSQFLLLSSAA